MRLGEEGGDLAGALRHAAADALDGDVARAAVGERERGAVHDGEAALAEALADVHCGGVDEEPRAEEKSHVVHVALQQCPV